MPSVIIGVLKESKEMEQRVGMTPHGVGELIRDGHVVFVESNAGIGSGYLNLSYQEAGAKITSKKILLHRSDLVIKVKEPTFSEVDSMRRGQMLFCFLHLAAMPKLTKKILTSGLIALGYETLKKKGHLPLLAPMSAIAGQLATQIGAQYLRWDQGGRGILLGGTETVCPGIVVILGGGVVGENAAKIACGLGAETHVVDISKKRLRFLKNRYPLILHPSTPAILNQLTQKADLLIGAVLVPGKKAPRLVTKKMVQNMQEGSVIIDVAVDQGGVIETTRVTTHRRPFFKKYGVIHYGVANMPGIVPVTSTKALTKETLPYIRHLARWGLEKVISKYPEMASAVQCDKGMLRL